MSDSDITSNSEPGYDKGEASVKKVIFWGIVAVTVFVAAIIWAVDYFTAVKEEATYSRVLSPSSTDLRDLKVHESEILTTYKLLDSAGGIYQIPIERAMEILADEAYQKKKDKAARH
nr:hypothetical protein [candidate division Zixibacteria bacterium]